MRKKFVIIIGIFVAIGIFIFWLTRYHIKGSVQVDDISIAYHSYGHGKPLVLIAGYGSSTKTWDLRLLLDLSRSYRVIVFDNRGIGESTLGSKTYTMQQCAEDARGLLDQLHINNAYFFGYSMGACIAQELAIRYPQRIKKLILGGANALGQKQMNESIQQLLEDTSGTDQELWERKLKLMFPAHWFTEHAHVLKKVKKTFYRNIMKKQIEALKQWTGTGARLKQIKMPTLLIVGTEDVITPPTNALMMVQNIPHAWLIQFIGCGHGLPNQDPYKLSRVVKTFLN